MVSILNLFPMGRKLGLAFDCHLPNNQATIPPVILVIFAVLKTGSFFIKEFAIFNPAYPIPPIFKKLPFEKTLL